MSRSIVRRLAFMFLAIGFVLIGRAIALDRPAGDTAPEDQSPDLGPDVILLRELEDLYEPVPFDHKSHAEMAQMWMGCVTCHHRPPHPTTGTAAIALPAGDIEHWQQESDEIPACRSCHSISAKDSDIRVPSLKGAYHRQCLNCHKEWMHENACAICHQPKENRTAALGAPTPGDIIGRMHPPIEEPNEVAYRTRFTPADGNNVLFRHREHTAVYGIRCVDCHHQDNCTHCHNPRGDTTELKPLRPGWNWDQSHAPCMACHQQSRCQHCHFQDDQPPPSIFDHAVTGQLLDEAHAKLACAQCHGKLDWAAAPLCGGIACHKRPEIDFPAQLPGPLATTPTLIDRVAQFPADSAVE